MSELRKTKNKIIDDLIKIRIYINTIKFINEDDAMKKLNDLQDKIFNL